MHHILTTLTTHQHHYDAHQLGEIIMFIDNNNHIPFYISYPIPNP